MRWHGVIGEHRRKIDPQAAEAWQTGQIDFADLPLSDAIAQVNRYSTTQIAVNNPALSDQRISGRPLYQSIRTPPLPLQR